MEVPAKQLAPFAVALPAEFTLLKKMHELPEVVADIATSYEVHRLAYYAQELAKAVHHFYKEAPILSISDQALMQSRIQLVFAARNILGQTLDLLGIGKRDVM